MTAPPTEVVLHRRVGVAHAYLDGMTVWRFCFGDLCKEGDPAAWEHLRVVPAEALEEANRKLPCGCHKSNDDSYGGCVLCKYAEEYERCNKEHVDLVCALEGAKRVMEAQGAIIDNQSARIDVAKETIEHLVVNQKAGFEERDAEIARLREALGRAREMICAEYCSVNHAYHDFIDAAISDAAGEKK